MAATALALYLVYMATAFGLRSWLQWRHTGSTGFRGLHGAPGSPEWWAGVLFAVAVLAGLAAPLLQLTGILEPVTLLDNTVVHIVGIAFALAGIAGTLAAQQSMGRSWRIGVDPSETTALVRSGVFAVVRNPVFTAMLIAAVGLTLIAPNLLALAAWGILLLAIQMQVRIVEEPYLYRAHGTDYANYAADTGRFIPHLGRITR